MVGEIEILMYLRKCTPYGEARVALVASHIKSIQLAVAEASEYVPTERTRILGFTGRSSRRMDASISSRLGHKGSQGKAERLLVMLRLAMLLRKARTVYTVFGWNAIEVHTALRHSRNDDCKLVFSAAGSDISAAVNPRYIDRLLDAANRAELVLCGSEYLRGRALELGFDPQRTHVHHLGTVLPALGQTPLRKTTSPTFLAVSRLHPVKGLQYTIKAFSKVLRALPEAELRILGEGSERERLQALTQELGISGSVRFEGLVGHDVVHEQMRISWVFVQHNVRTKSGAEESLSGSVLEAQACELPVIGTYSGGIPESVADGSTGILVPQRDVDAMAEAMITLARDADRRERMGRAGRARVNRHFNARSQDAVLESILQGTGPPNRAD